MFPDMGKSQDFTDNGEQDTWRVPKLDSSLLSGSKGNLSRLTKEVWGHCFRWANRRPSGGEK